MGRPSRSNPFFDGEATTASFGALVRQAAKQKASTTSRQQQAATPSAAAAAVSAASTVASGVDAWSAWEDAGDSEGGDIRSGGGGREGEGGMPKGAGRDGDNGCRGDECAGGGSEGDACSHSNSIVPSMVTPGWLKWPLTEA